MPTTSLAVSDIVNVQVSLSPVAAQQRNFGVLCIAGATDVIDTREAIRTYSNQSGVGSDFGGTSPEYLAALAYFSQSPQPAILKIARWAKTATSGVYHGATLTPAQAALANFTGISAGAFDITIDGSLRSLSAINLSGAASMAAVAAIIQTALSTWATCTWDANRSRFNIQSTTSGASSTIGPITTTALSTALGISTVANPLGVPVAGIVAETPAACAARLMQAANDWYGLMFADTSISDAQHVAVAAVIEASSPSRIYGISSSASAIADPAQSGDLASLLKGSGYNRTFLQYTTITNFYTAAASIFGRAFTVNFSGSRTAITLKFKVEPGIASEYISESAAAALQSKNCNIFVNYNNGVAIIQEGVMAGGNYIDETINLDWFQNAVQTALFNTLYGASTKIPQTDEGMHVLAAVVESVCESAVTNGVLAGGQWNAPGFGQLAQGDMLPKGYYIYMPPIATQSQADRAARKAVLIQVAAKFAGAVHFAYVSMTVNR